MRLKPIALSLLCFPVSAIAAPSLTGQSGIVNMPDARVEVDGTFSMGYSFDRPYSTIWLNNTILPFLQMNGRFVTIKGTKGFVGTKYEASYGDNKDKVIDMKLRLLDEGEYLPQVAYGKTDVFGTELFKADYLALSKRIGSVDLTAGYGRGRINGAFGGVRWNLPTDDRAWTLLAEYDANDYRRDYRASQTDAAKRSAGPVAGLQYRWGWLGAQITRSKASTSVNTFVNIPFNAKEFVPKVYEPQPYSSVRARPTAAQWREDSQHRRGLLEALHQQDYRAVSLGYQNGVLNLSFSNTRISDVGRSVGRALRTAMYFAPLETRGIKVRVNQNDVALADYEFFDLPTLQAYLNGKASRAQLNEVAIVRHARPGAEQEAFDTLSAELDRGIDVGLVSNEDGNSIQFKGQDKQLNGFNLSPKVGMYFNDPSGALRYEVNAQANGVWRPAEGHYVNGTLSYKLLEDVSKVDNPSNSLLPHVRTDIAEYKKGNPFRLTQLAYTTLFQPGERLYGKVSAGLFEEMFGGLAGQLVYFPRSSRWMTELTVEAVQQRDYDGWFGRRDYKTVSALASLHYKLPQGVTITGRAGRFLAKDSGVRMEFKRRFKSGIEAGAWYTYTDGKDTTSPGSVSNPYHDKGLFMSIPLDSMLPADSQSVVNMSISPWTRDVGQRVSVPHDLVRELEEPTRQLALGDGLGNLGERGDDPTYGALPDPAWWPTANGVRTRLGASFASAPELSDTALAVGGAGLLLAGAASRDRALDTSVSKHKDSRGMKAWDKLGRAAPVLAVGAAGTAMALSDDPVLVNTAIVSLESAALAAGLSIGAKKLVDRARPTEANGDRWARSRSSDSSFPSNHAAVTFAAITPFAQEYRAPWLYGVAGLTSAGRVAGRKHWASDVVAGGLLGYGTGYWLWKTQRKVSVLPEVSDGGKTVGLNMAVQY